MPQFLTDGQTWRAVVWNASPDELDAFDLFPPAGMPAPRGAVQVTGRGERLPAKVEGTRVTLSRPMYEWEYTVLL